MAGLVRPRSFPIRDVKSNEHQLGMIYNPLRYPDHGGFTSARAWPAGSIFNVEAPTRLKTAEISDRGLQE